ncbi:MAG: hypothetical protein HDR17_03490 [Lachnospiraceae bacterium]|nr:hypothetical protein [Lachnospiraceae bacterium]
MKSYRDRYFEDYIAVPDPKRNGKIKYMYAGQYVEPFVEGKSLERWKIYMTAIELVSIIIFFATASMDVLFTYNNMAAGIGTLAVVPWILEIWSVFRFVVSKGCMKETDRQSIARGMEAGALIHGGLLFLMVIVGCFPVVRAGELGDNIIAILGHLCMAFFSFTIWRLYKRVYYYTYRDDGKGKADEKWIK